MNKNVVFFTGLMLCSFFFGAGNLIFPPMLGLQAGDAFWPAILGFIVTAVTLPVIGIAIVAVVPGGIIGVGEKVGPRFALVFAIIVHLAIGPLYAIPRAANVGYDIGFARLMPESISNYSSLMLYIVFFFGICYFAARHSGHLVDLVGKILTPILLGTIALLSIVAFRRLDFVGGAPDAKFADHPFTTGIIEGYLSMDAIAALAFGAIVLFSIKKQNTSPKKLVIQAILAGCIAGFMLAVIYLALAWIGGSMPSDTSVSNGAELLYIIAEELLGIKGRILFGIIVILACMTTCIGLINVCSMFSHQVYPRITYGRYVIIFTVLGALCANVGLTQLLAFAVPLLLFIYPVAIALMGLNICRTFIHDKPLVWQATVAVTLYFAVNDFFSALGWKFPFADEHLAWLLPAAFVAVLIWVIQSIYEKNIGKSKEMVDKQ